MPPTLPIFLEFLFVDQLEFLFVDQIVKKFSTSYYMLFTDFINDTPSPPPHFFCVFCLLYVFVHELGKARGVPVRVDRADLVCVLVEALEDAF